MAYNGGAAPGGGTWEQQKQHYNSHVTNLSTNEALQQRKEGPAQELKHFHNHVKRLLLWRFAHKQDRLLDMCCGRGGDLQKWKDAQVKYVRGLDISDREDQQMSGPTYPFGLGYICDIADTVTASMEGTTDGSLEYLVDLPTLQRLAGEAGLHPVTDYMDPVLAACFEQQRSDGPASRVAYLL
ncbi:mRNA cap guanine-N7 methyltransferase [Tetrabaena socialis]|uniref:mRNA (guanine-N(7))-methyltransferase n=1 Tax=Tetrabaena socialis TaxID=47790 RepID=A0A2J8A8E3_9CHLO|nr:mRNA cap guanine-N7 methyltransferase [Tetrabaena socialis]|eukprot:PNH08797.1 mRNA cap guanine-N7 methyltransferase [Tetrabaena socialis]